MHAHLNYTHCLAFAVTHSAHSGERLGYRYRAHSTWSHANTKLAQKEANTEAATHKAGSSLHVHAIIMHNDTISIYTYTSCAVTEVESSARQVNKYILQGTETILSGQMNTYAHT